MHKVVVLTDYKGFFGSRHDASPYRSGFVMEKLNACFSDLDIEMECVSFGEVDVADNKWVKADVLYTSSEDPGYIYKQYIEDIIMALEARGSRVIPSFNYLRANNNKVYMELLRSLFPYEYRGNIAALSFGCLDELIGFKDKITFPVVIKGSAGAMGRNVFMADNYPELIQIIKKKVTRRGTLRFRLKERIREVIHKGYTRESFYRGKFIIQQYIPGLSNDWKVYYFGDKAFVFFRPVMPGREFRASGGGYDNYSYGTAARIPDGMLDFGWKIFRQMNVPNASFDIAWDGSKLYLLEFQCVYFGTAGILKKYSSVFFQKTEDGWKTCDNEGNIEKVYAESIAWYFDNRQ